MDLQERDRVLDMACGQGVLARYLPGTVKYLGVDLATNLIAEARKMDRNREHQYLVADITKPLLIDEKFDWAVIILGLQNLDEPEGAIKNASKLLESDGKLLVVLNHPCFRIPKQSDWIVKNGKQWRGMASYLSKLKIPIETSPFDKKNNRISWSYHYPLSDIVEMLSMSGMLVEKIEEWVSDKHSVGGAAKMENKARSEIPLFMTIVARKSVGYTTQ